MKKGLLAVAFITTAVALTFANGSKESENDILVVGTEGTYKPFSYHNNTGELVGYDVEVIKAVAGDIGYQVRFEESRWDGLLAGLQSGRWDVVANQVWWNESRNETYLLSDPYLVAGATVLVKDDNPARSSTDLAGKRAAVSLTTAYRPIVESLTDEIEFQDDFILAVDLLRSGRVDFLVNDTQAIGEYLAENSNSGLKPLPLKDAETHDVVFALSKDNPALLEKINTSLVKLEKDGTIGTIRKKYFADAE